MCQHAPFRGTWHMLCAIASTPLAHYMIRARARFCYSQWGPGGGGGGRPPKQCHFHIFPTSNFCHSERVHAHSETSSSRSTYSSRGTCSTTTNATSSDLFLQRSPKCRSRICKCWLSSSPRNISQPSFAFSKATRTRKPTSKSSEAAGCSWSEPEQKARKADTGSRLWRLLQQVAMLVLYLSLHRELKLF